MPESEEEKSCNLPYVYRTYGIFCALSLIVFLHTLSLLLLKNTRYPWFSMHHSFHVIRIATAIIIIIGVRWKTFIFLVAKRKKSVHTKMMMWSAVCGY